MSKIEILWREFSKNIGDQTCDIKSLGNFIKLAKEVVDKYRISDREKIIIDLLSKLAEECMDEKCEEIYFDMLKHGTIQTMVEAALVAADTKKVYKKMRCCIIC
tara:strand:- start:732 stop:1043 length:312 start_codon:yes stop_codon:yes gene_type:complete